MEDLPRMMELFADARVYMAENGNPNQWKTSWPPQELIVSDIGAGKSYVCVETEFKPDNRSDNKQEKVLGTFFFSDEPDPTYSVIYDGKWLEDTRQYGVVHRITTDRNTRGVGSFIINWAFEKHQNLRIDTHEQNIPMRSMLEKNGFTACGTIILANGEPRIAFQKINKQ